eukprot:4018266-Pyramimonas_sp.AAC.1
MTLAIWEALCVYSSSTCGLSVPSPCTIRACTSCAVMKTYAGSALMFHNLFFRLDPAPAQIN